MWLFTTQGFYSTVQHDDFEDMVIVRGRTREDIEALRHQIPSIEPFEDPDADYRYRAVVAKADWALALTELATDLDYRNFKSAVAERQGYDRAAIYGKVWAEVYRLQEED